jgi:hypothetical protein
VSEIEPEVEDAPARNRRVTRTLVDCAGRFGLTPATEFPVPGGRIDVAWLWRPAHSIPGVENEVPLVGFEIESSWRTRKHIKGDLLNLQDLRPLIGVIVLLGEGPEVESTRRFASQLVDRPGPRILVWSEEDIEALVSGEPAGAAEIAPEPAILVPSVAREVEGAEHSGKYRPLWVWLRQQRESPITTSFGAIEAVLGFALPPSSRRHLPHWYGYEGTAVGRAIRDGGWRARHVDLGAETVVFERVEDTDAP